MDFIFFSQMFAVILDVKAGTPEDSLFCLEMFLGFLKSSAVDTGKGQGIPQGRDIEKGDVYISIRFVGLGGNLPVVAEMLGFVDDTVKSLNPHCDMMELVAGVVLAIEKFDFHLSPGKLEKIQGCFQVASQTGLFVFVFSVCDFGCRADTGEGGHLAIDVDEIDFFAPSFFEKLESFVHIERDVKGAAESISASERENSEGGFFASFCFDDALHDIGDRPVTSGCNDNVTPEAQFFGQLDGFFFILMAVADRARNVFFKIALQPSSSFPSAVGCGRIDDAGDSFETHGQCFIVSFIPFRREYLGLKPKSFFAFSDEKSQGV